MIGITGANGHLGRTVIRFLLKTLASNQITAIVRKPAAIQDLAKEGIIVRQADYNDYPSLVAAFKDIEKLLQISTTSIGNEAIKQENNVVQAAKSQNVKHIIYTSSVTPKQNAAFLATLQSLETEKAIRESGLTFTFFRNNMYMEAIPELIGDLSTDEIRYPAGNGKVGFVSRNDIGEAIAKVLTEERHKNKCYEITGEKAYSFQALATMFSAIKNKDIIYSDISDDSLREQLIRYEMPNEVVDVLVSMAKGIRAGEFSYTDDTLHQLLNRKPLGLEEYLQNLG